MHTNDFESIFSKSKFYIYLNKFINYIRYFFYTSFIFKLLNSILNRSLEFIKKNTSYKSNFLYLANLFFNKIFSNKINLFVNSYNKSTTKKILDYIFNFDFIKYISDSKIFGFIIKQFLKINIKNNNKNIKLNKKAKYLLCALILFLIVYMSILFSIFKSFAILFLLFIFILIIRNINFGIYLIIFFLPILKTKFIICLSVITIISFFINFLTRKNIKINFLDLLAIFFSLLVIYESIISYYPKDSLKSISIYLLAISIFFVIKNIILDKKDLFIISSLLILSSGVVALTGIYQKLFVNLLHGQMWIDTSMFSNTVRVYSTLDNPNVLGEYFIITIPIILSSIYYFKNKICKLISFFILSITCLCMLLTLSRGAWIGLLISFLIFAYLRDKKLLFLFLILFLMSPIIIPTSYIERFMSIGNLHDTSSFYRLNIWFASLDMLKIFWPIGIGHGSKNFLLVFQKYAYAASYALHTHNFYLQLLIENGIVGFVNILFVIIAMYRNFIKNNKFVKDNFIKTFRIALCSGMTGYLIQGFVDNIWYNNRILFLFWIIVSLSGICFNLSYTSVWQKFKYFQALNKKD